MIQRANAQATAASAHADSNRTLDVLVIGTGFSGVCVGIKLLEKGISNFRIYEKSQGIGGTWYDNTYPGAACDVPSHFYCYSFEPNPNWSRIYSPRAEIQSYIEGCVDKYGLRPYIVHGATVVEIRLDEQAGLWRVTFADGNRVFARHVINGSGGLHKPSIPDFPGRDTFSGAAMHTARWDHTVDLSNKRVAVIGSAASAIQVIPEVARIATAVSVFQRTPNYIAPRGDRPYTDSEKQRFARWPWLLRLYRWFIYKRLDILLFPITKKDSKRGRRAGGKVIEYMRASVKNSALHEYLQPDYAMGCKRILLSDDIWRAFNRDNVTLEPDGIERMEPQGVRTKSGTLHAVDVIVYATGFDIDGHLRSIKVYGQGGRSLEQEWAHNQEAYRGGCVTGFPNYWMVTGPNTGVATTSVVYMVEQMVRFIIRMIEAAGENSLITVKRSAQEAYNARLQAALDDSVWASGCNSWYITDSGKITTLYPNNAAAFKRELAGVSLQDFEFIDAERANQAA
jgi:cation diffusion facilitator CzcD-associated flavoprotein CzcO